ncbi:MAG: FliI/YscN family ATPase [Myxococcaceae bacterium]|nr:FliI/YscN family ATPase [Myxococcaceae bacterium]
MAGVDLDRVRRVLDESRDVVVQGRIVRATGLLLEASLPQVALGTSCEIRAQHGRVVHAEVVGFNGPTALLVPFGDMEGICEGCAVVPRANAGEVPVGDALLGRVVDARLQPIDGGPALLTTERARLLASPPAAMSRRRISDPMPTGVRAIDACLTLGEGQRVGIMAGPGVGKSVLLGMVARHSKADVIVVGLIGERGREVREFIERDLGLEGLRRSVVVVATGDEPPLVRVRAAMSATAAAEHFRSRGHKVMLLMDSLSRVAMAQREIGLAAGEPPTSKGYPPSVFAMLPRLVERAGNDAGRGSITALYTVLAEGDDLTDPVTDCARAALDGHVVLSRKLANAGHFPAVDILSSVSRCMSDVTAVTHREAAMAAREVLSAYREAADLIEVGAYQAGSNPRVDRALACVGQVNAFLKQGPAEHFTLDQTLAQLNGALKPKEASAQRPVPLKAGR